MALLLGWSLGKLLVHIVYNGHGEIQAGAPVLYKKVGSGGGVFVCPLKTFFALIKSINPNDTGALNRTNIALMGESKVISSSSVKPIEKLAK